MDADHDRDRDVIRILYEVEARLKDQIEDASEKDRAALKKATQDILAAIQALVPPEVATDLTSNWTINQ